MHVFGLTGTIGSGKSSVAERWRARQLPVVDADALAREAVAKGEPVLQTLATRFGSEIINPTGHLDRAKLAQRVFGDESALLDLNKIVHPKVQELAQQAFAKLSQSGTVLACYEVPLLFESNLQQALRPVVVVTAPESNAVQRIVARDGCSTTHAQERINAQMPAREKRERADIVVDNSGTLAELVDAADRALDEICARLDIDPLRYPKSN